MRGTLAELLLAREQVTRKKREDYEWDRKAPLVGKKAFTSRGVGNITAVSICGERMLVYVAKKARELMFPTSQVRMKAFIKTRNPPDAVSKALNGLDINMLKMVCLENGIDYKRIEHLNEGMQKMAISNAVRKRIRDHGSAFIVDKVIRSFDEDDQESK